MCPFPRHTIACVRCGYRICSFYRPPSHFRGPKEEVLVQLHAQECPYDTYFSDYGVLDETYGYEGEVDYDSYFYENYASDDADDVSTDDDDDDDDDMTDTSDTDEGFDEV